MESWQIEIVRAAGIAVISFFGGLGTYWLKTREQQKQRHIEYDDFRKKRKLIGGGEVERMERADKLTEIIIKHRELKITPEEFEKYRDRLITGRKRSPKTEKKLLEEAAE